MLPYVNALRSESYAHLVCSGGRGQTKQPECGETIPDCEGTRYRRHLSNYQFSPFTNFRWSPFEAARLHSLEFENRRLSEDVRSYVEDVNSFRASWSRIVRRCQRVGVEALTYSWSRALMNLVPFNVKRRSIGIFQNLASLPRKAPSLNHLTPLLNALSMNFHAATDRLRRSSPHHPHRCCIPAEKEIPLPKPLVLHPVDQALNCRRTDRVTLPNRTHVGRKARTT